MSVIKTPDQIHPNEIYLPPEQYKAIKRAKMGKPFNIKNKDVADILRTIGFVKLHQVKVRNAIKDEDGNFLEPAEYENTGKYLLQIAGDYYIKYRKEEVSKERKENFHKWAALIVAGFALLISILSLILDYIQMIPKQ